MMRSPRAPFAPTLGILATLALGCTAPTSLVAGVETGPCVEGDCFEGLMCLSDLCVGEDAVVGGTAGDGGTDANDADGGATSGDDRPGGGGSEDGDSDDRGPDDSDDDSNDADSDSAGDTAGPQSCDALDILFVIDNSPSMGSEQARLLAALPGFIEDIDARLVPSDPHFMVTDADAWPFEPCDQACDPPPECLDANGQCDLGGPGDCFSICTSGVVCSQSYPCEGFAHDACDEVLGAGVDHTFGASSSQQECEFASGGRYIDGTEPDVLAALDCAMRVGTDSFVGERPMQALVEALRSGGDAESCNEGFVRDGAILVVVFITDEDDDSTDSAGNPAQWHTALLEAKGGDPNAVVVLGLFGDGDLPFSQCASAPTDDSAESSPRLRTFMQLWGDKGVFGSICAPGYGDAFAETVDVLQTQCAAL